MIATDSYSDDQYQLQSVLPLLTYVWYMCGDTAFTISARPGSSPSPETIISSAGDICNICI